MKIQKLTEHKSEFDVAESEFIPTEKKVQGATVAKHENAYLIVSPVRYKLFTDGTNYVKVLEGNGHFKWARGEVKFSAGDEFLVESVGEYELNGAGKFFVVK